MTQTPAGWFADPQDPTQFRYWDGTAWTDHRSPRGPAADQLNQAATDLADGLSRGFTAVGTWVNQNTAATPGVPTFASVAASCRDEPARQPLSMNATLVLAPTDLAGVAAVFAQAQTVVTAEGVTLDNEHCRLVPNPWDPAVPNGVAVFVGSTMVGRLPADLEATYCPPLAQLTSKGLVATAVADLGPGRAGCGERRAGHGRPARGFGALVIRPLLAALLVAAVALPAAPAEAGYTPVPYAPLPTSYEQLPLGPRPRWRGGRRARCTRVVRRSAPTCTRSPPARARP